MTALTQLPIGLLGDLIAVLLDGHAQLGGLEPGASGRIELDFDQEEVTMTLRVASHRRPRSGDARGRRWTAPVAG